MDLQCPATIACLAPGDALPTQVGGQKIVAAYCYGEADLGLVDSPVPVLEAPRGKFWEIIPKLADQHRGEGIVVYCEAKDLQRRNLRGVNLSVDSLGPVRI